MKAKTSVREAVKLCYAAYAEYSRVVQNMPVKFNPPVVHYEQFKGWWIDGNIHQGSAPEVIAKFDACQRYWWQELRTHQAGLMVEQPPKPPELDA